MTLGGSSITGAVPSLAPPADERCQDLVLLATERPASGGAR
jgi:hypothetical protein